MSARAREHAPWHGIVRRCTNPKDAAYKNYGARGIADCDRWLHSFKNFVEDMGDRPSPEHSIDRMDNDGNYEPENCRWVTAKEQRRNQRQIARVGFGGNWKTKQRKNFEKAGVEFTDDDRPGVRMKRKGKRK